jgi:hypothetical protein
MAEVGECTVGDLPDYCDGGVPTGLCMVEAFLAQAANPTRDLLLHPYALVVGLVMILQFHLMPVVAYLCEEKALAGAKERCIQGSFAWHLVTAWAEIAPSAKKSIRVFFGHSRCSNFARCLGRNVIILNIYYNKGFAVAEHTLLRSYGHHPLVESVIFAFFESAIVHQFARRLQKRLRDYSSRDRDWAKGEIIDSKFSDFSVPWSMATITFVGQFALFFFFVLELNGDGKTHEACSMNVFHWLTAVIVTNVAGLGESGVGFHASVWHELWKQRASYPVRSRYFGEPYSEQYCSRCFYAVTINGFCREVLLCLAPVALSVVDRGDLVKDCLAIFFICKMDDLDQPKTISKVLEDWEKEVQAEDLLEEEERNSMEESKEAGASSTLLQRVRPTTAGREDQRGRWEDPKQGVHIPKYGVHIIRDKSASPRPPLSSPRFPEP